MRKKLLIVLLAVLCCNGLFAQDWDFEPEVDTKGYRMAIGPKVGGGVGLGSHSATQNLDFSPALSYQLGGVFNAHFGRRHEMSPGGTGWIGLQLEALYGKNGVKLGSEEFGISCLEVPVLLQLYVAPTFAVELGATMVKVLSGTPASITNDGVTYNTGQLKGADVRPSVGVCYKDPSGILVDARYNLGMSPLAGNFDTKISSLMLSFTYLFTIVK